MKPPIASELLYRFELAFFIGPCTVAEANALTETLLDLPEAKAVGIGAIGSHAVDDNDQPIRWPDAEAFGNA